MSRNNAMAAIEARQRREQFMQDFKATQSADMRQRMQVDFEVKGEVKMAQKDLHRHLDKVQARHNDSLVQRRARLAELLQREQAQYETMLSGLAETDEERRERLIRRARELKAERAALRQVDNQARHDRLFREQIDTLRLAESRLKVMQVADLRYDQLSLAERRKAEEDAERAYFEQQAAEALRLANERAQRDLELRHQRVEHLQRDLTAQVEGNTLRREAAADEKRRDDEEFYRLLHEERIVEAQKQAAKRAERERIAQEMKELNEELQQARMQEYDQLRKEDKETLEAILAVIAEEQRLAQIEKRERTERQKKQMEDLQLQMAQRKDDTQALDKLWEEANDRQWGKREAQWKADQARRDQLLRSILIARRQQVMDKRQQRADEAETRAREHAEFLASLSNTDDIDEKERQRRMHMLKENQRYLDAQIAQRQAQKDASRDDWRTELTEQQALEKANEDRIAKEMAALEAAKPERYRNVPLLPPRSRNVPF
ncbi:hypothetical protein STCU_08415 [Strigomonas culicis]|uniref:Cilia- and flagella-associated protein 53 n=2 Tax=Strigomonas culicis TaxID=28005 RepID=S9TZD7_9TRYP|nr:hypothetical protein STCU_08415 [Strigomonas culicis]|eukprot:EPY21969.1 hypothetical protein STCU_08415 [Strigomonas culicis]